MRDLLPYLNNFNFCFGLQTKYSNNMENEILLADKIRTCAYQGGTKCSFFGKFGVPCSLETPILIFTLLSYYQRLKKIALISNKIHM